MKLVVLAEAGYRTETAMQKGRAIEKRCACGAPIPKRKTWCSPCYDVRLQANIAANRSKYR
jgi:hypothetical protein